jgi:hypothetical protein
MSDVSPVVLHRRKRALDVSAYRRLARESDYAELLTEPTVIVDDEMGAVSLLYVRVTEDTSALEQALRRLDIRHLTRTGGLQSYSRTFGYHPAVRVRNNFCGPASLAGEDAEAHGLLSGFAPVIARVYEQYNPSLADRHRQLARAIRPEWRLEETPFTSGIVNRDSALAYHFDGGNVEGVWSAMLGFKRHLQGGYLALPQYDIALEIGDRTLTFFDGQGLLHGVTTFAKTHPDGYRFTVVYYSLVRMWLCLPPDVEAKRARHSGRQGD